MKGKRGDDPTEGMGPSLSERTMMIPLEKIARPGRPQPTKTAPAVTPTGRMPHVSGRQWRPFHFTGLSKVSKLQALLSRRIEWLFPVSSAGAAGGATVERLKEILEQEVTLSRVSTEIISASKLNRFLAAPVFLAVLAPLPQKTRGLLEVELKLAHQAIDLLLGGSGESAPTRPLTEIEEGVMTYVVIETLKAIAPTLDASLPKLRIEGLVRNAAEGAALIPEDESLAVVTFDATLGENQGLIRLFLPQTVLEKCNPPDASPVRDAKVEADLAANAHRLSHVKVVLRAEIGKVEIQGADLQGLNEGDVVLVDALSCRPDKSEGGSARLRVGLARNGSLLATVGLKNGRFMAKIGSADDDPPPQPGAEAAAEEAKAELESQAQDGEETPDDGAQEESFDNDQGSDEMAENAGAGLVNDIPLQMTVELGRVTMTGEELVGLSTGHVFDLNKLSGEPLDLSVNGKVIGRGEVVEVDGNLGIRIVELS